MVRVLVRSLAFVLILGAPALAALAGSGSAFAQADPGDAGAAQANTPGSDAPPAPELLAPTSDNQIPLTPALVQRFLDSWPELSALGDQFADQYGVDEDATDPASAFQIWAERPEAKTKIDAVLTKHGFGGLDEWAKVANSVLLAYDYDESLTDPAQIADAVREIEATPGMSRQEKDSLIAQVHKQAEDAAAGKPLDGNRAVIEPFMDRIGAVINADQGEAD